MMWLELAYGNYGLFEQEAISNEAIDKKIAKALQCCSKEKKKKY